MELQPDQFPIHRRATEWREHGLAQGQPHRVQIQPPVLPPPAQPRGRFWGQGVVHSVRSAGAIRGIVALAPLRDGSDTDAQRLGPIGGAAVANPLALMRGRPRVVVIGDGALLLGECSGPAYRIDGSSSSWAFTMS